MVMIHICTELHMPIFSSSLVSATKPEAIENIWLLTMLLFYTTKKYPSKSCIYFKDPLPCIIWGPKVIGFCVANNS